MGADPVTLAIIAGAMVATSAYSIQQQKEARNEQKKAQREQGAANAERAAAERRQQIREERIRRAQIEQASANSGTMASSGAMGATGGLNTTLASNLGFNLAQTTHANNISVFNQRAASLMGRAQTAEQLGSLTTSLFSLSANSAKQPGTSTTLTYGGDGFGPPQVK